MSISREEVNKLANLACIKLTEEEKDIYGKEINNILAWIDQLQELDTSNVEAIHSIITHNQPLRSDSIQQANTVEQIFSNAPSEKYQYYAVPKVIE